MRTYIHTYIHILSFIYIQAAALACAARLTNAMRSPKRPFGALPKILLLIEELAGATDLKSGIHVEHVVSRNKTKDLSDISTNF